MGNEKCRIHLDTMQEIIMMAVLNLKWQEINARPPSEIRVKQILK